MVELGGGPSGKIVMRYLWKQKVRRLEQRHSYSYLFLDHLARISDIESRTSPLSWVVIHAPALITQSLAKCKHCNDARQGSVLSLFGVLIPCVMAC